MKSSRGKKLAHPVSPVSAIPVGPLSNDFEALELWQTLFSFNIGTKKWPTVYYPWQGQIFMCKVTQSIVVQKFDWCRSFKVEQLASGS